jgi:O-antigen/teichoic acid export membrane protein
VKHNLLKNSVVFASSRYVLLGLSMIRNFFVAKYLGPSDYGLWIVIGLLLTYGDQIHLGLRHAGDKEIPYYRGQGKGDEGKRIADSIFGGVIWLSCVAFFCLMIYSFLFIGSEKSLIRYGVLVAAFIIVSDQVNRFYLMILRTRHEFLLSSKVESGFELLRTILVSGLAVAFHFYGAIVGLFVASMGTAVYFLLCYSNEFRPRFSFLSLKSLFAIGLPLSVTGLLYILILNLDRLVGAFTLSKDNLGIYGLASLVAQVPVTSSQGISQVIYPQISEKFGETRDPAELKPLFTSTMTGAAFIAPFLVASIFLVGRFLILWVLPAYQSSIGPLFLLSFGIYFLYLVPVPASFLMAMNKNILYLKAELVASGMAIVVCLLLILTNSISLPSIALLASGTFLATSILLLIHSYDVVGVIGKIRLREIAKLYAPALYSGIILLLIYYGFLSGARESLAGYFLQTVLSIVLYSVAYLPVLLLLQKNTGIPIKVIRSLVTRPGRVL